MGGPAQLAAPEDKRIQGKQDAQAAGELGQMGAEVLGAKEDLPAPLPVKRGRWALKPHGIPVGDAEGRKQRGKRIADESRVNIGQVPGPDHNQPTQARGDQHPPRDRLDLLVRHRSTPRA